MQAENGYTRDSLLHCEVDLTKENRQKNMLYTKNIVSIELHVIHEEHCIYRATCYTRRTLYRAPCYEEYYMYTELPSPPDILNHLFLSKTESSQQNNCQKRATVLMDNCLSDYSQWTHVYDVKR